MTRIRCLGNGDAFGSGGRLQSCFCIETNSEKILVDFGASGMISLKKYDINPDDIRYIIISHLHGDHFGGIPFLLREAQIGRARTSPLTLIGPAGLKQRVLDSLQCFFPALKPLETRFQCDFIEYPGQDPLIIGPLYINAFGAIHTPGTNPHSLRIEIDNTVICYSGDTEWNLNLIEASADADVFICEGNTYSMRVKYHMSIDDLVRNRKSITARKIVLTHLGVDALSHLASIPFQVMNEGEYIRL